MELSQKVVAIRNCFFYKENGAFEGRRGSNRMRSPKPAVLLSTLGILALLVSCRGENPATEVIISLERSAVSLAEATIIVDYSRAGARPLHRGGEPACASILPNVVTDFSDDESGALTVNARSKEGFSAPVDLAVCRMIPDSKDMSGAAIASQLRISLAEGRDIAGRPLGNRELAMSSSRGVTGSSRKSTGSTDRSDARSPRYGDGQRSPTSERRTAKAHGRDDGQGSRTGTASSRSSLANRYPSQSAEPDHDRAAPRERERQQQREVARAEEASPSRRYRDSSGLGNGADGSDFGDESADAAEPQDGAGPGSENTNDDSDNDAQAVRYAIQVAVTSDSGTLGALQFDITHLGASGGFVGAGGSVDCAADVAAGLTSFNDRGAGRLSAAFVDLNGFSTPTAVATCRFKTREQLARGSFQVTTIDASPPGLGQVDIRPTMEVVDVYQVP